MEGRKLILDAACGGRMFWFDKKHPNAVYCDSRDFETELCDGRHFEVKPDVQCDFTALPFPDESFKLVVFDPPHLFRAGEKSWMSAKYGKLPADWQEIIRDGFQECMRVLETHGVLIFKWCEEQIRVSEIIEAVGQTPLFGHKSGKREKTHWLTFMKL